MDIIGIVGVATGSVAIPIAATATAASIAAVSQSVGQQGGGGKAQESEVDKSDPRLAKFNLIAQCTSQDPSPTKNLVHGKIVVLREKRLFLDAADPEYRIFSDGHPFSGFYIEYPAGEKPLALVSTISRDPPELNWVYVDKDTLEFKYGNKTASIDHIHGPFDWTENQGALVLEGWEGFVAVEISPGIWQVFYDRDDDLLLASGIAGGRRVVECSLAVAYGCAYPRPQFAMNENARIVCSATEI